MKWKAACLELLDYTMAHTDIDNSGQELAEEVWGWPVALEVHAAYAEYLTAKLRKEAWDAKRCKKFKENFNERPLGNDLRTQEGRLAYLKAAEEETAL